MAFRLPSIVELLALCVLSTALGCGAMSPAEYDRLAPEVLDRNATRQAAAVREFEAAGYTWDEEAGLLAQLTQEGGVQCEVAYGGIAPEAEEAATPLVDVTITATHASREPEPPQSLRVALDDACAFFANRSPGLQGVDDAGATHAFVRIDGLLTARTSAGERVLVQMVPRVVSERTVLVEQHCNEMPRPAPGPFEDARYRPVPPALVIRAPAPRQIQMDVEQEVLDYKCTDVVQ